jgi:hypothetical protein
MGHDRQPPRQPLARLTAQLLHLVLGETRQDRVALGHPEGAAPRDLDGVGHRLGQVGEQRRHLGGRLEVVLRGQPPPRLLLVDVGAVGDADERVMRLEHLGLREIHVIGGDKRQVHGIGHLDEAALGLRLGLGQRPALPRMPLKLDIEPARPDRPEAAIRASARARFPCWRSRPTGPSGPPDRAMSPSECASSSSSVTCGTARSTSR